MEFDDEYTYLEIVLVPCNLVYTIEGYSGDSVSSECVGDQEEQIKYLGPSHFVLLTNNERLNPYEYG